MLLSKALFGDEDNPFETMFATMLVDRVMLSDARLVGGRLPKIDDDTLDILSEEAVLVYLTYLD